MPRLNSAPDGGHPQQAGNGFLMRRGFTLVWSGWQGDVTGGALFASARTPADVEMNAEADHVPSRSQRRRMSQAASLGDDRSTEVSRARGRAQALSEGKCRPVAHHLVGMIAGAPSIIAR
jgi:hypothetical protein